MQQIFNIVQKMQARLFTKLIFIYSKRNSRLSCELRLNGDIQSARRPFIDYQKLRHLSVFIRKIIKIQAVIEHVRYIQYPARSAIVWSISSAIALYLLFSPTNSSGNVSKNITGQYNLATTKCDLQDLFDIYIIITQRLPK